MCNPYYHHTYTVHWTPPDPAPTYLLQQAPTNTFLTPTIVYNGANTTWQATAKPPATYYYRVKAIFPTFESDWSNIQQTTVLPPVGWQTIVNQDFEGDFPNGWRVVDNNGKNNGNYQWHPRNCRPYSGNNSGWAVGGGDDGLLLACADHYPSNADTWLIYGPFSLETAIAAELRFKLWQQIENDINSEFTMWGASLNGSSFNGYKLTANNTTWSEQKLDLANVPGLGSLLGKAQVWVGLEFVSDDTLTYPEGSYVDNIILRFCEREPCSSGRDMLP